MLRILFFSYVTLCSGVNLVYQLFLNEGVCFVVMFVFVELCVKFLYIFCDLESNGTCSDGGS